MSHFLPYLAPYSGWILILALATLGLLLACRSLFPKSSPARRSCPNCNYDLRFSPTSTCSECGHTLRSEQQAQRPPRKPLRALLGLALAAALPTLAIQYRLRHEGLDYYTRLHPFYFFSPDKTIYHATSGPYILRITEDRRRWSEGSRYRDAKVEITRDRQTLFSWHDYNITPGVFYSPDGITPVPPLTDLNADGIPEFICQSTAGGNSGFYATHVFSLGPTLVNLNPHSGNDTTDDLNYFTDLDHDGKLEAVGHTGAFSYFHCCHAASIYPKIIFRLTNQRFVPAPDLMRTPNLPLTPTQLAQARAECLAHPGGIDQDIGLGDALYSPLIDVITQLLFSGHPDDALSFLNQAWPGDPTSKSRFLQELHQRIQLSTYQPLLENLGYHPPTQKTSTPPTP